MDCINSFVRKIGPNDTIEHMIFERLDNTRQGSYPFRLLGRKGRRIHDHARYMVQVRMRDAYGLNSCQNVSSVGRSTAVGKSLWIERRIVDAPCAVSLCRSNCLGQKFGPVLLGAQLLLFFEHIDDS